MEARVETPLLNGVEDGSRAAAHTNAGEGISVSLCDVSFKIGAGVNERIILRDVSVRFQCGHVTALLGPSGAGKTTLLSLLCGHAADWGKVSGTVHVNGKYLSNRIFRRLGSLVKELTFFYLSFTEACDALLYTLAGRSWIVLPG